MPEGLEEIGERIAEINEYCQTEKVMHDRLYGTWRGE